MSRASRCDPPARLLSVLNLYNSSSFHPRSRSRPLDAMTTVDGGTGGGWCSADSRLGPPLQLYNMQYLRQARCQLRTLNYYDQACSSSVV
eukprot:scaffold19764_cov114-Isochrysis_galbana.AAC.5